MPKQASPLGRAEAEARRVVEQLGYNLVDIELVKESTGRFLRLFIDKEGGIALNDCETCHRRVQKLFDDVEYDYFEVSSPGADRPLKKPEDFDRAQGLMVEVHLYKPVSGAKLHKGYLVGVADGFCVIEKENGVQERFEMKQVALMKPSIDFTESDLKDEIPVDEE